MNNPTDTELLNFINTHLHKQNTLHIHTLFGGFPDDKGVVYKDIRSFLTAAMEAHKKEELDAAWKFFRERTYVGLTQDERGFWSWVSNGIPSKSTCGNRDTMVLDFYRERK